MAETRISSAAALTTLNALVDLFDAGAGSGILRIYTGTQPTDLGSSVTGQLLATLTLSDPAFGDAVGETSAAACTAASITADTSAAGTGIAGYFRATDSDNLAIIQGDCGASAGAAMFLDNTSIASGQQITITQWVIRLPKN